MSYPSPRHAAARHRRSRRQRVTSPRVIAATAIGGVLLSGAAVASPAVLETPTGSTAQADPATQGELPLAATSPDAAASRGGSRPGLSTLDETAATAADQVEEAAAQEKKDAAAAAKKRKAAKAAAAKKRSLAEARQNPQAVAQGMLADYGWGAGQFSCLDALWRGESGWNYQATNPSSGAYGIPQSLPASKMAAAGDDWETNPTTQIRWGLDYIRAAYGSPCSAQGFKSGNGFY